MVDWIRETLGGYRDNPVTLRDFRVQFRNGRTVTLLIIYTLLLTLIAWASYASATDSAGIGIAQIQSTLTYTYGSILICLYVLVCTISAFSAAFSVTAERQRKALDLVFSAPFSPRRYVLGKVIGGLRYAGILIALALPAMTTMVAAGGATVEDILVHAVLLAANAFAWCAVGVAFAGNSRNFILPLAATCGVAFFWNVFAFTFGSMAGYTSVLGMASGPTLTPGGVQVVDWYYCLSSTTVGLGFSTPSQAVNINGMPVPSWIPAVLILVLIARFAVVAGAASLEFPPGRSSVWLRIHGLVYVALCSAVLGLSLPTATRNFAEARGWAVLCACAILPLLFTLFFTAPFGPDKEAKKPDNTAFDWRGILEGKSTSALPYSLALVAAWWLPLMILKPYIREPHGLMVVFHSFILFAFWILVIRYGSSLFKTAVMGRLTAVMVGAASVVFTIVATISMGVGGPIDEVPFSALDLTLIRPWFGFEESQAYMAWFHIIILTLFTAFGFIYMEKFSGKKAS